MPKVSVCIPTYNRASLFRATLKSVLRQSLTDLEIIVSDDASQENIESVVTETADPRIRFFAQPRNLGQVANMRFLEALPRGEYVLFLCSDDLLLPVCLERAVQALDSNPTRGGVVYMAANYGEGGFESLSTMPALDYADADIYRQNHEVSHFLSVAPSLCLYRRATFQGIGGWDRELLAVHDWEMYSRMVRKGGGICYLHEVLAIMRSHDNRVSNTSGLHWDFYHDVLIISSRPELRGTAFVEARAIAEQLLWDLRLKQYPWATLKHAWSCGAMLSFLLLLPYEIIRRTLLKARLLVPCCKRGGVSRSDLSGERFERRATDAFWMEMTRTS